MVNPAPARPYDLAVAYRIYPGVSRTPLFAGRDKLDLARVALESFRAGLGGLRAKIWVLLDNCPPSYRELFLSLFDAPDLELLPLDGEGNWRTFRRQIDLLAAQEAAEVVYFAEDDYLYLPDSLARMTEFLRAHADADFLTAYDHPDLYRLRLHRHPARTRDQGATRWRTTLSTCLTFMTTRRTLRETRAVFESYARGNSDLGLWMSLTKFHAFNPFTAARCLPDGGFVPASIALAWRHAWRQLLRGRRYHLWTPAPSLATHMEATGLAPGIPWAELFAPRLDRGQ